MPTRVLIGAVEEEAEGEEGDEDDVNLFCPHITLCKPSERELVL